MSDLTHSIEENGMSVVLSDGDASVSAFLATKDEIEDPENRAESVKDRMELERKLQEKLNSETE